MNEAENAAMGVRVVRIIWLAFLISIFIYAGIMFAVTRTTDAQPFQDAFAKPVTLVLQAAGAGMFAMAFVIPSLVLRRLGDAAAGRSRLSTRDVPIAGPATRIALITRWALIEAVAVFGVMAGFIAHDVRVFLPLGGLALAGMLMTYPSDSVLRDLKAV